MREDSGKLDRANTVACGHRIQRFIDKIIQNARICLPQPQRVERGMTVFPAAVILRNHDIIAPFRVFLQKTRLSRIFEQENIGKIGGFFQQFDVRSPVFSCIAGQRTDGSGADPFMTNSVHLLFHRVYGSKFLPAT